MPKNQNIVTKVVNPSNTTGAAVAVGSSVAAGMTRYVTFVHVSPRTSGISSGALVFLCSTAAAATASTLPLASAAQKMRIMVASHAGRQLEKDNISIPAKINTENPLFSVAAGKFLTVFQASAGTFSNKPVSVFVQYYDQ